MVNVNDFKNMSDNDMLDAAIKNRGADGVVIIPPRKSDIEPERDFWLLDRAVLLPSNTTVILMNSKIKLSDKCRDNFFRSDNCGMGITENPPLENIHIKGIGKCMLEGADHPRATGDGSKTLKVICPHDPEDIVKYADWVPEERRSIDKLTFLDIHENTYGTDAGKEGESQKGDWRNIGILFACVSDFSIENITIKESHAWAISLENCTRGFIEKIHFDARMSKLIDGMLQNIENEDGVDIRNGCNHITISDISGETGDDVVALTAGATNKKRHSGGVVGTTHVMHNDWTRRDPNIHDIIIRNVRAYSSLCWAVRLLTKNTKIWNVVIDGIVDTSPKETECGLMIIGDMDATYPVLTDVNVDNITNVTINNVIYNNKREAIRVDECLKDSVISNVISSCSTHPVFSTQFDGAFVNVKFSNIQHPDGIETIGNFWKYYKG